MSWTEDVPSFPPVPIDELHSSAKKWEEKGEWKKQKDLAIKKAVSIVTCMDCRVLPDRIFDLDLGDAEYIRNAGGRVTDDIIRSLLIAQELLNTKEVVLMHHTDCGAMYATKKHDELVKKVKERLDLDLNKYDAKPITPPTMEGLINSVKEDVELLDESPFIAKDIPIYGVIYHCESGKVEEVCRRPAQSSA